MRLKVLNREEFRGQVSAFINKARTQAQTRIRGIMLDAQQFAADRSPTYSGDFASNWNVSAGSPDTSFTSTHPSGDINFHRQRVLPPPRDSRWGMGNFSLDGFRLGQTVYLTNAAQHEGMSVGEPPEPYAWLIEEGKIVFREPNKGLHGVGRATARHILSRLGV